MINKDKLNAAFAFMREAGLIAKLQGVCTYNRQDAARMKGGYLYLGFGPVGTQAHGDIGLPVVQVGHLVVSCLAKAGLAYEWDGTASRRILVTG